MSLSSFAFNFLKSQMVLYPFSWCVWYKIDEAYARILILLLGIDSLWNWIYELLKKRKNDFIKTISISKFSLFIWIR